MRTSRSQSQSFCSKSCNIGQEIKVLKTALSQQNTHNVAENNKLKDAREDADSDTAAMKTREARYGGKDWKARAKD